MVWEGKGGSRSLFHKSSPMIYAKHAKTILDDFPGENMEYGPRSYSILLPGKSVENRFGMLGINHG